MRSRKISLLAIPIALMVGEPDIGASAVRTSDVASDSSVLDVADPFEPGTRLVVTGRVLRPDGKPAAGRMR